MVKFDQWSNLTTDQIPNWSNSKLVKFDHWSNSQVVESAQFRDLAIFTKWSNSRLVKFDQWFINGSLTFMTDEPARAAIPLKLEAHASREHTLAGPLWEGYHESRRCSRDTYSESYITKYTHIRR